MRSALLGRSVLPVVVCLALGGCSVARESLSGQGTATVTGVSGRVHGGQQPVIGSTVQLWTVGGNGYGVNRFPLGNSVVTDNTGSFNLSGQYNCNTTVNGNNTLTYVTATGGNPGSGPNAQLLLMTALGTCGSLTPSTFISINEVTTVAAVYSLAQFMSADAGLISSYSYSATGLANAFATAASLANISTGVAPAATSAGNGSLPQAKINTLANAMASCVNSASVAGSPSAQCTAYFNAAKPAGGTAQTNTAGAMRQIALNPGNNVGGIFGLGSGFVQFAPTLGTQPNDWTLAVAYAGGGLRTNSVAIDASGNVWTANYAHGVEGTGSVSKLGPTGAPANGSPFTAAIVGPDAVAINLFGNPWVANFDANQIVELSATGASIAGPFQYTETLNPRALAIDGANNIWIANSGNNTLSETPNGAPASTISPTGGFLGGGLTNPAALAIDGLGNAWAVNPSANRLSEVSAGGTVVTGAAGYTGGGMNNPSGIAFDHANNAWVSNLGSGTLSEFTNAGVPVNPSGYSGGGLAASRAVAVDGAGQVWVVNQGTPSLSQFSSSGVALSPITGFQGGNMGGPGSIAIDGSGNVWVGNATPATVAGQIITVSEFVGLAAPSITPLAQAILNGNVGQMPGTPIPITINTTFLPSYAVSKSYFAQLSASGGNTGSFTWTLNTGTLPTGITLAASGLISGTTTQTGSFPFTVKVCDTGTTNCAISGTLTLTASTSLAPGGKESELNGNYVVRFSGFNNFPNTGGGTASGFDELGVLTFNGAGAITGGEFEFNNPSSTSTSPISVTGTYTLGADQRGLMILNLGSSFEFAISVGNLNASSIAQDMRYIEFDDTRAAGAGNAGTGAGVGKLQTSAAISLNQSFVFGVDGETPCTLFNSNGCANGVITPFGAVAAIGHFTGNGTGSIVSGQEDASANNTTYSGVTLTGSYTAPDSLGRGTLTLNATGGLFPLAPTHFTYYSVSPTEMYIMSSDGHANFTLLSGDVQAQTTAFTAATQLSGNYIYYGNSPTGGNGVNSYPATSIASAILATASGTNVTVTEDRNRAGSVRFAQADGTIPYAFDTNGRLTLAGGAAGTPVFYFANAAIGFGLQLASASNQGDPGLGTMELQTGGPFSCTTGAGLSSLGDLKPPVPMTVRSGNLVQNGTTSATLTIDSSSPNGNLSQGQTATITCTPDTNGLSTATTGRVLYTSSTGGTNIGYLLSPSRAVIINMSPSNLTPDVIVVQK